MQIFSVHQDECVHSVYSVSELSGVVREQSRPRSPLHPALLMACNNVTNGHTTSLGFYAG